MGPIPQKNSENETSLKMKKRGMIGAGLKNSIH
jgi:hypothetical protein